MRHRIPIAALLIIVASLMARGGASSFLQRNAEVAQDIFEEALMLEAISPERAKEDLLTVVMTTDPWSEINRQARNLLGEGGSYVNLGGYRPLAELLQHSEKISSLRVRIAKLREIAARYPNSPVPHYLIGWALETRGDMRGAVWEYRKAIKIRGTCAPCEEALERVLVSIP